MICEFIGICVIGTFATTHFKNLLPVVSLMSGISIAYLIQNYKVPLKPVLIIIWIVFFPKLLNPFIDLKHLISPAADTNDKLCTNHIRKRMIIQKKNWVYGLNQILIRRNRYSLRGYGSIVQAYAESQSPSYLL